MGLCGSTQAATVAAESPSKNGQKSNDKSNEAAKKVKKKDSYIETKHDHVSKRQAKTLQRDYHDHLMREHKGKNENVRDFYAWSKKDILGSGISGDVIRVTHKSSGKLRAMKTIRLNRMKQNKIDDLRQEINIMKTLDHPNVVKLYETFEERDCIYMIMELCTGGELFDRLFQQEGAHFTEKKASVLVRKMLSAIHYLHMRDICHRDLKLENFIFETKEDDSEIKLIDFGLSKVYHGGRMKEVLGTSYYVAPEVLKGSYGMACDIWGMGVITYMMLSGLAPFGGDNDDQILRKVRKGKYDFPAEIWSKISDEARDFVRNLLIMDPTKRMTCEEALKHQWIVSQCHTEHKLDQKIIDNLGRYAGFGKFKRAALFAVAFVLGQGEIVKIRDAFEEIDVDANGFLTYKEFHQVLKENGVEEQRIKTLFSKLDHEKSGTIDYTEFIAAALEKRVYLDAEALADAFHEFDLDGTGYITHENLKKVMGDSATDAEVAAMIAEADFAHDGKITLEEFKTMMAGVVNKPETDEHMQKTRKRAKTIVGADLAKFKSNIEMAITKKRSKSVVSATDASPTVDELINTQQQLNERSLKPGKSDSAQTV